MQWVSQGPDAGQAVVALLLSEQLFLACACPAFVPPAGRWRGSDAGQAAVALHCPGMSFAFLSLCCPLLQLGHCEAQMLDKLL
jgi:hypothetical protein